MENMTLDDFRDYVLFKIMDSKSVQDVKYFAVDCSGMVYGFLSEPHVVYTKDPKRNQWMTNVSDIILLSDGNGGGVMVQFPDNIDWTECMWKI